MELILTLLLCVIALYFIVIFIKKITYRKTIVLDLSFSKVEESADKMSKFIQYHSVPLKIILECLNKINHDGEFDDIECHVFRAYDTVHKKVINIGIRFSIKSKENKEYANKQLLVRFAALWTANFRKTLVGKIYPISIGTPKNLSMDIDIEPISV